MYCYYFNLESIYPASTTFSCSCYKMCPRNNTGLANFYSLFSPIPLAPKDLELEMLGGASSAPVSGTVAHRCDMQLFGPASSTTSCSTECQEFTAGGGASGASLNFKFLSISYLAGISEQQLPTSHIMIS